MSVLGCSEITVNSCLPVLPMYLLPQVRCKLYLQDELTTVSGFSKFYSTQPSTFLTKYLRQFLKVLPFESRLNSNALETSSSSVLIAIAMPRCAMEMSIYVPFKK